MNCTLCNEPMVVLELDQIEIDYCLECGGIWLDSGELESLVDDVSKAREFLEHPAAVAEAFLCDKNCPICLKPMQEIVVGSESPVHIDRCLHNHGLWFDRGELEEVVGVLDGGRDSGVARLLRDIFERHA